MTFKYENQDKKHKTALEKQKLGHVSAIQDLHSAITKERTLTPVKTMSDVDSSLEKQAAD